MQCIGLWLKEEPFQPKFPKSDALHRILVEWVLNSTTFQPKFDAVHRILVERSFFSVDFIFLGKKKNLKKIKKKIKEN